MSVKRITIFGIFLGSLAMSACSQSPIDSGESPVERGEYLFNSVAACGNCHSTPNAEDMLLAGRFPIKTDAFTAFPKTLHPMRKPESADGAMMKSLRQFAMVNGPTAQSSARQWPSRSIAT
jgi:hypothetical protein